MRISEANPLCGQPVDTWCGNFRTPVIGANIALAQIVGEDQHNVGLGGGHDDLGKQEECGKQVMPHDRYSISQENCRAATENNAHMRGAGHPVAPR